MVILGCILMGLSSAAVLCVAWWTFSGEDNGYDSYVRAKRQVDGLCYPKPPVRRKVKEVATTLIRTSRKFRWGEE